MKKTIGIIACLSLSYVLQAQTIDDGIKMYKYERYQTAVKDLTPLAAGNATANYYLGLSQLGLEDTKSAAATFAKFPDDPANMAGAARVAYATGNTAQGMTIAKTVADKAKKKDVMPLKYAADALTYEDNADYQQAILWYKKALEGTDDADVHISLGDAYQKVQGGGGEAMNNYEHVTEKDQKNSLAYSRIGALWYAAHVYQSALDNYSKAKDADPSNPLPYRDLAYAYYFVGKFDLAKQNIEQYLQLSDKSEKDMLLYGDILYHSKSYPDAIKVIQPMVQGANPKPFLYHDLGMSQLETGDSAMALDNMRKYFSVQDPKKIDATTDYTDFARVFMKMKQNDSANFYFNKAASTDTAGDKSAIYRKIAETFKDAKEYQKSAEWYNKLVTANPGAPAIDYFWAVVMYYYAKDYTNGTKVADAFVAKYPAEASAQYWRGRVAAAQDPEGKDCLASPYFTKWLEMIGPNADKKSDMKLAYEYLLICSYNKKDKAAEDGYKEKLRAIDPADDLLKQIEANEKAPAPKKGK